MEKLDVSGRGIEEADLLGIQEIKHGKRWGLSLSLSLPFALDWAENGPCSMIAA